MKLNNVNPSEFATNLTQELLFDIGQAINTLSQLASEFLIGRPERDQDDVTDSNIPKLLHIYKQFQEAIEKWAADGFPSSDDIGLFSLFDAENLNSKKETTFFVIPMDKLENEIVRVDGYEKAKLAIRKSYQILGHSVLLMPAKNDFMGFKLNNEVELVHELSKSASWKPGYGGDKGEYQYSGSLQKAKITYIYNLFKR